MISLVIYLSDIFTLVISSMISLVISLMISLVIYLVIYLVISLLISLMIYHSDKDDNEDEPGFCWTLTPSSKDIWQAAEHALLQNAFEDKWISLHWE